MTTEGIINVVHICDDGFHEFTSPQIPGLYVVTEKDDLQAAFEDIKNVIGELIFADYGIRVSVEQEQSYSEYLDSLPEEFKPTTPPIYNYYIKREALAAA